MIDPLSLPKRQLRFVEAFIKSIPASHRPGFLISVARHLVGPDPSDSAVFAALNVELDRIHHLTKFGDR